MQRRPQTSPQKPQTKGRMSSSTISSKDSKSLGVSHHRDTQESQHPKGMSQQHPVSCAAPWAECQTQNLACGLWEVPPVFAESP